MNPFIRSSSNIRCPFLTYVSIVSLAFPFPLLLPIGAIAVSWQWIYIQNVSIMIKSYQKEAEMESSKLCRLLGVFWNERRCIVQVVWCWDLDAVSVQNTVGKEIASEGGKNGYIYSNSGDCSVQGSTGEFFWLTNTKRPSLRLAEPPGTSLMASFETIVSTRPAGNLPHLSLHLHHTSCLPLRPLASLSKLSSSQVVPTVQPSNMATNN